MIHMIVAAETRPQLNPALTDHLNAMLLDLLLNSFDVRKVSGATTYRASVDGKATPVPSYSLIIYPGARSPSVVAQTIKDHFPEPLIYFESAPNQLTDYSLDGSWDFQLRPVEQTSSGYDCIALDGALYALTQGEES